MSEEQTRFDAWMKAVDDALLQAVGVGVDDIEDRPYRDWFEVGVAAPVAATYALGVRSTDDMLAKMGWVNEGSAVHSTLVENVGRRFPPQEQLKVVRAMTRQEQLLHGFAVITDAHRLCDFRHAKAMLATVDGATKQGPWANMCDDHYDQHGVGLGIGRGQLLLGHEPLSPA